jgi:lysophospholipase L1-like esterase
MKLIGFGCSFTYGSELLNPELEQTWDQQIENIKYRENKVWLGVLAKRLGLEADNYSQPACSNYAIQEIFAEWFNSRDVQESVTVVIGWTNHMRNSWWHQEQGWIHDGFIRNQGQELFKDSFRDWLKYSAKRNERVTDNAKLFVNSVCKSHNIPIIQFNALANVTNSYQLSNYHQGNQNMKQVLESEGARLGKTFLADGGHPNESGHEYYVEMLYSWIKAKNIV